MANRIVGSYLVAEGIHNPSWNSFIKFCNKFPKCRYSEFGKYNNLQGTQIRKITILLVIQLLKPVPVAARSNA